MVLRTVWANQILLITDNPQGSGVTSVISSMSQLGYVVIVRSLPQQEGDMASLSFCGSNLVGYLIVESRRTPTLAETIYITNRVRKIKLY